MDWNDNTPMELLAKAPECFNEYNLNTIQAVIDNDKIICSTMLGYDVCGTYAPFCAVCEKFLKTPCAVAYIRWRQAQDILQEAAYTKYHQSFEEYSENENADDTQFEESAYDYTAESPITDEFAGPQEVYDDNLVQEVEEAIKEPITYATVVYEQDAIVEISEQPQLEQDKKRIRIAVAKRKIR